MKLVPSPSSLRRTRPADDTLGQGVDAALAIAVFLGAGYLLDRWLGTAPWLMIGCFLLGAVGQFYSFKARYAARMDELEAQRAQLRRDAGSNRQTAASGQMIQP